MDHRKLTALTAALSLMVASAAVAVAGERAKDADLPRKHPLAAEASDVRAQELDEVGDATWRIWGQDRYGTAAAIAEEMLWTWDNTFTVYLASGEPQSLADALALGPSTFADGPLLLTQRDVLPAETRRLLEELEPCWIVAVGGTGVISDAVLEAADGYADPDNC